MIKTENNIILYVGNPLEQFEEIRKKARNVENFQTPRTGKEFYNSMRNLF